LGQRKARRIAFFRDHPNCCFCGGLNLATTEDHWPPRSIFRGRAWPEGFVFPACVFCNESSRVTEKLLGLLLHGSHDEEDRSEFRQIVASIRKDFPGLIEEMLPNGANEVRRILRHKGIAKPENILLDQIPLIKLEVSTWQPHFDLFARKMMLALHYQCFRRPLSAKGRLWYVMHTNADAVAGEYPREFLAFANLQLEPQRNRILLNDQFNLRWQFEPVTVSGVWTFSFHNRVAFTGITSETRFSMPIKKHLDL
jgi:hypothetical protein